MTDGSTLLFGGTFDPPHLAHTRLPPIVADKLGCTRVLYVPASANPLKHDHPTPAEHRLAMLRLALRRVASAEISTIELDRQGPSYTIDTLESLHAELGTRSATHLLIGADQAIQFHRWKDWRRILEFATPAVMLRPPWTANSFRTDLARQYSDTDVTSWTFWMVDVPQMDISATDIRRRIAEGEPLDDVLDIEVEVYIRKHGLYESGT